VSVYIEYISLEGNDKGSFGGVWSGQLRGWVYEGDVIWLVSRLSVLALIDTEHSESGHQSGPVNPARR